MTTTSLKILITLFCYFLLFSKANAAIQCSTSKTLSDSTCSASPSLTRTNLGLASGSKQVCVYQSVQMSNKCSQTDNTFIRVQAEYTAGSPQDIFRMKYSTSGMMANYFTFVMYDSSGTATPQQITSGLPTYGLLHFVCIDVANGYAYAGIHTRYDFQTYKYSVPDYTSLSSLDSVTFYFCNDGTNSAQCTFESTTISYGLPPVSSPTYYLWGLTATLIRSYEEKQGSGTSLFDSKGSQDASFGSNAPSWSTTSYGVEFTADDQYVTIPTFTVASADQVTAYSFTVSMWIKLTSLPSVESYLFRRSISDLSQDLFVLKVGTDGSLSATIGTTTFASAVLSTNQWIKISSSLGLLASQYSYYISIEIDSQSYNSGSAYKSVSSQLIFSSSDQVRIGGPTGVLAQVYGVEIYSPGSPIYLPYSCGSDTATTTLGINNVPYLYSCHSSCSKCFGPDATDCLACSTASSGIYNSLCQACPTTTFLNGDLCSSCVDHCDTCSTTTICDVCSAGYSLDKTKTTCNPDPPTSFVTQSISALQGGRTTADATTQIATIAGQGNPVGVQAQVSGKIFFCIQYFNITYSTDVYAILKQTQPKPGKGDSEYVPDISSSTKSDLTTGRQVPYMFEKYSVPASFILNFWKNMIFLIVIFAVVVLAIFAEFFIEKWDVKYVPALAFEIIRNFAQNYLLSKLYGFWGNVILYTTLQYRTIQFRTASEWIDFFVSLIFLIAVFTVPVWHFLFLLKYRKVKKSSEHKENKEILKSFQDSNKAVKIFFNDYKDKFMLQQLFLIFLTTRDFIFNLLLTTMFDHPLAQIIISFAMNISMIIYIVFRQPFRDIFNLVQQIFYEGLLFVAHIILLVLVSLDLQHSTNTHARDTLGKILIIESLIYTYGSMLITSVSVGLTALEFIKEWKKTKAKEAVQAEAKLQYLETEEAPCRLASEENTPSSPTASKLKKIPTALSGTDEEAAISLPTSQGNSPTNKLVSPDPNDLEARKESKFKNIRLNSANDNETSEVIDGMMVDFPYEIDPSSPNKLVPESPRKKFKNLRLNNANDNETSEIIDGVMVDFPHEIDPSSPSKLVPESPRKKSKFVKNE